MNRTHAFAANRLLSKICFLIMTHRSVSLRFFNQFSGSHQHSSGKVQRSARKRIQIEGRRPSRSAFEALPSCSSSRRAHFSNSAIHEKQLFRRKKSNDRAISRFQFGHGPLLFRFVQSTVWYNHRFTVNWFSTNKLAFQRTTDKRFSIWSRISFTTENQKTDRTEFMSIINSRICGKKYRYFFWDQKISENSGKFRKIRKFDKNLIKIWKFQLKKTIFWSAYALFMNRFGFFVWAKLNEFL